MLFNLLFLLYIGSGSTKSDEDEGDEDEEEECTVDDDDDDDDDDVDDDLQSVSSTEGSNHSLLSGKYNNIYCTITICHNNRYLCKVI